MGYLLDTTTPYMLWGDECRIRCRSHLYRLLCQPEKQLASRRGLAAVESENKFVEVVVKVIKADGSLVGTHQPPLEKRDDTVGARQQVFAFRLVPLHRV